MHVNLRLCLTKLYIKKLYPRFVVIYIYIYMGGFTQGRHLLFVQIDSVCIIYSTNRVFAVIHSSLIRVYFLLVCTRCIQLFLLCP